MQKRARYNLNVSEDEVNPFGLFGVYRPVSADTSRGVRALASRLCSQLFTTVANRYGGSHNAGTFNSYAGGVTLVKRSDLELLRSHKPSDYSLKKLCELILADEVLSDTTVLPVGTEKFAWYGKGALKLVLGLKMQGTEAGRVLAAQKEAAAKVMGRVGLGHVRVYVPDHLTIAEYGSSGGTRLLSDKFKGELARVADEYFEDEGFCEVDLDPVVVGHAYNVPVPEFQVGLQNTPPRQRIGE